MDNTVFLNTNREMPLLGLGVYKATGGKMRPKNAIISAVESGYRLIDTAPYIKRRKCRTGNRQLWNTAK